MSGSRTGTVIQVAPNVAVGEDREGGGRLAFGAPEDWHPAIGDPVTIESEGGEVVGVRAGGRLVWPPPPIEVEAGPL